MVWKTNFDKILQVPTHPYSSAFSKPQPALALPLETKSAHSNEKKNNGSVTNDQSQETHQNVSSLPKVQKHQTSNTFNPLPPKTIQIHQNAEFPMQTNSHRPATAPPGVQCNTLQTFFFIMFSLSEILIFAKIINMIFEVVTKQKINQAKNNISGTAHKSVSNANYNSRDSVNAATKTSNTNNSNAKTITPPDVTQVHRANETTTDSIVPEQLATTLDHIVTQLNIVTQTLGVFEQRLTIHENRVAMIEKLLHESNSIAKQ
ncbi:G-protein beta wd-40 repeats containing protein [Reticulomyxa filosa]|uniref:G-protein beta wd-40 repeats containing protein n=1 Tax=Reticulomyxa filosa TaxID=46433 RepID=X6P6A6_RETFI|nr:G-protein beta wd-40 repeats containing protein [Reticulomyxa filosa]|eukprot:ETO34055.1 G-protein beta wd-40 repeats containing protein [Reticulomyxa filosa]